MANSPTPAELTLLRALWVQGELSAREIHDETVAETGWSYSSTRKTLDRMEAKKFLQVKSVHRMKVFVPARSKLATLADLINHFASDFLDTKNTMSAAAFAGSDLIDPDEIDDLQALLDALSADAEGAKK